jgi:hypothetical protein
VALSRGVGEGDAERVETGVVESDNLCAFFVRDSGVGFDSNRAEPCVGPIDTRSRGDVLFYAGRASAGLSILSGCAVFKTETNRQSLGHSAALQPPQGRRSTTPGRKALTSPIHGIPGGLELKNLRS